MSTLSPESLQVAPTKEVMLAVSTYSLVMQGMLGTFLEGVEKAGVSNYLVVALDKQTEKALGERKQNVFYMDVQVGALSISFMWWWLVNLGLDGLVVCRLPAALGSGVVNCLRRCWHVLPAACNDI